MITAWVPQCNTISSQKTFYPGYLHLELGDMEVLKPIHDNLKFQTWQYHLKLILVDNWYCSRYCSWYRWSEILNWYKLLVFWYFSKLILQKFCWSIPIWSYWLIASTKINMILQLLEHQDTWSHVRLWCELIMVSYLF